MNKNIFVWSKSKRILRFDESMASLLLVVSVRMYDILGVNIYRPPNILTLLS